MGAMEGQIRESEGFHSRFYFLHCDEARPAQCPPSTLPHSHSHWTRFPSPCRASFTDL